MKIFTIIILIFFLPQSTILAQEIEQVRVEVKGLACPFCAASLENSFVKIEGIGQVKIELEDGIMSFEMSQKHKLSVRQIKKLVKKAGFTPGKVFIEKKQLQSHNRC